MSHLEAGEGLQDEVLRAQENYRGAIRTAFAARDFDISTVPAEKVAQLKIEFPATPLEIPGKLRSFFEDEVYGRSGLGIFRAALDIDGGIIDLTVADKGGTVTCDQVYRFETFIRPANESNIALSPTFTFALNKATSSTDVYDLEASWYPSHRPFARIRKPQLEKRFTPAQLDSLSELVRSVGERRDTKIVIAHKPRYSR